MAKNKKRSLAAKKAAKKAWATRRANALAKQEPKIGSKIRIKMPEDYKLLDGPLLEIKPELGPAALTMGTEAPQLNLREIVEAMDKLVARFYSLLG